MHDSCLKGKQTLKKPNLESIAFNKTRHLDLGPILSQDWVDTTASFDPCEQIFIVLEHEVFPPNIMCCARRLSLGLEYRGQIQPRCEGTKQQES